MHKFNLEIAIETEHKDCCNGCKFVVSYDMGAGQFCRVYGMELSGKWAECTGLDYFEFTRPEICKDKEKTK